MLQPEQHPTATPGMPDAIARRAACIHSIKRWAGNAASKSTGCPSAAKTSDVCLRQDEHVIGTWM
ncbi:MAG TPA: hypothetical protein VGH28_16120 [Polyangiaceae bacterium]